MPDDPGLRRAPAPRRMVEADVLRVGAMFSVVAVHAVAWPAQWDPAARVVYPAVDVLVRFGVPAFVLLTGYVLTSTRLDRPLDRTAFARARCRRVLVPFLLWAGIYIVCALSLTPVDATSVVGIPLLVWDGTVAGHLYFLPVALQLYLLFAVLPRSRRAIAVLAAVAVPLEIALVALRTWAPPLTGRLAWAEGDHAQWLALWFVGVYALGALAGAHRARLLAWLRRYPLVMAAPLLTGPIAVADILHSGAGGYDAILRLPTLLHAVATAAALLALGARLRSGTPLSNRIEVLAQRALGVYLVHPLILTCLGRATQVGGSPLRTDGTLAQTLPVYVLLVVVTTAVALVVVRGIAALPFGWALGGREEAARPPRPPRQTRPVPAALPVPAPAVALRGSRHAAGGLAPAGHRAAH